MALKYFYEGVEANSKAVSATENDILGLFYAGEKKPHIWWNTFDIRLTNVFEIVDKDAVH